MNIRFVLANVNSRNEEKSIDANVQAATGESSQKQTWKPIDKDGRETKSCQNEPRLELGGLLKNLVFVESDKPLTDYLIERETAVQTAGTPCIDMLR